MFRNLSLGKSWVEGRPATSLASPLAQLYCFSLNPLWSPPFVARSSIQEWASKTRRTAQSRLTLPDPKSKGRRPFFAMSSLVSVALFGVVQKQQMPVAVLLNSCWIGWGPFIWSVLTGALVIYYWTWSRSRYKNLVDTIPGPSYLPFLGNFLDLNVDLDSASSSIR